MREWRTVTLGDVIALQRGYDLPERQRTSGNVPVYGSFGITGYHDTAKASGPGVLIGRSGASFGVVNYAATAYWPHNAVLWVTDFKGNDPRFVSYLLKSMDFTSLNSGSAQPSLNRNYLYPLSVRLPEIEVQHRIATILSTYDDLIENNSRRIEILEEMAQIIYREWFVNFRFPGHEKAKMVASETGPIPEGWQISRIEAFGQVVTGKTPPKQRSEFFGTAVPFIKLPDMHDSVFVLDTAEHLSLLGQEQQRNKTLPANSLCVSCIGTAGIVVITTRPSQTNQQINSVVLNSIADREFLYFRLLDLKETINRYGSNGATMVNLNKTKFENLRIVKPLSQLINRYHQTVFPIFECIRNLQERNKTLQTTRDLLLPRLTSGEVRVDCVEPAAVTQGV